MFRAGRDLKTTSPFPSHKRVNQSVEKNMRENLNSEIQKSQTGDLFLT